MIFGTGVCVVRRSALAIPSKLKQNFSPISVFVSTPCSVRQHRCLSYYTGVQARSRSSYIMTDKTLVNYNMVVTRSMGATPPNLQQIHDRVMFVLKMFDKIDPEKLTDTSHFANDLGLNSLDHVEIIIHIEDDFDTEIPEHVMDRLQTPYDIIQYLGDRYNAFCPRIIMLK